jgi:hypothetical protein
MTANELRDLQVGQQKHDRVSHWDILCLPAQDRLKHMVLHFAKYVGRLADKPDDREFKRTLVDTFIIVLASANALNVDLAASFNQAKTARRYKRASAANEFFVGMARITGSMAKACEALDHVEGFDIRSRLERGAADLATLCVTTAAACGIDLTGETRAQWRRIEARRRVSSDQ